MAHFQPPTPIFTLRLSSTGGTLACTVPAPKVYLLHLTSPPDNRLTTTVCQALLLALDIIEHKYPPGVLVTMSGIPKFYSNGLDLDHAMATEGFWEKTLWPLFRRFLTYPMPTVAMINGHAFAGGLMLAMHHDYRIFHPTRGFLCLNELEFGVALMPPMSSIFRQKLPHPATYRDMVLEARRYGGQEALQQGIVDALGGPVETFAFIAQRDLVNKGAAGPVYGSMKAEMWRESVDLLDHHLESQRRSKLMAEKEAAQREAGASRADQWQANPTTFLSKL